MICCPWTQRTLSNLAFMNNTKQYYERGIERFHEFIKGLESQEGDLFYKSITKITVNFSTQKALKADCNLFLQHVISCQSRQCDLHEFFKYENQPVPASLTCLSDNGKLHFSARNLTLLIYFNVKCDTRQRTRNRGHRC